MTRDKLRHFPAKYIRDTLNRTVVIADEIKAQEHELILLLLHIDQHRLYVRYGFNSLQGFCNRGLHFTRTQSRRVVIQVRKMKRSVQEPMTAADVFPQISLADRRMDGFDLTPKIFETERQLKFETV